MVHSASRAIITTAEHLNHATELVLVNVCDTLSKIMGVATSERTGGNGSLCCTTYHSSSDSVPRAISKTIFMSRAVSKMSKARGVLFPDETESDNQIR